MFLKTSSSFNQFAQIDCKLLNSIFFQLLNRFYGHWFYPYRKLIKLKICFYLIENLVDENTADMTFNIIGLFGIGTSSFEWKGCLYYRKNLHFNMIRGGGVLISQNLCPLLETLKKKRKRHRNKYSWNIFNGCILIYLLYSKGNKLLAMIWVSRYLRIFICIETQIVRKCFLRKAEKIAFSSSCSSNLQDNSFCEHMFIS